jgi:cytochrome c oxidase cbb3-type subunit IV
MISGLVTGLLLLAFLGIAVWAWSARTQPRFDDAAQLPLRDEQERDA